MISIDTLAPSEDRWIARHGLEPTEFQDRIETYAERDYRLLHVSGHEVDGEARFGANWEKLPGPAWKAHYGLTSAEYQDKVEEHAMLGYRPVHASGYSVGDEERYATIWERAVGPAWETHHGLTSAEYQDRMDEYLDEGYRLTHVSGYGVNGRARFAAIWERIEGPAWKAHHDLSPSAYQDRVEEYADGGYRPTLVSGYAVGGTLRYAAIWERRPDSSWKAHHGLSASEYQDQVEEYEDEGYRPTHVNSYSVDGSTRYAAIWTADAFSPWRLDRFARRLSEYMHRRGVPGLSLAITKNERLVFARGYGDADWGSGENVRPSHRFRIASISKPITAVAVMELVESGDLRLDAPVFGPNSVLGTTYGTPTYADSVGSDDPPGITVRHLLQHTSGWRNESDRLARPVEDPMFLNPEMDHDELVRWVLDAYPVQAEPGTTYSYLNFGYCLLGRIIEACSGQAYEEYVRDAVLSKCGISRMELAGDAQAERKSEEVVYYGRDPYGMQVARMDAHGGWIATPTDLLRFVVRVDGFPEKTDVLRPATLEETLKGTMANPGYGEGWMLEGDWRGHNGALDGSIGFLVRRDDGFSFAVLGNARPTGDSYGQKLRRLVDELVSEVRWWPTDDRF